MLRKKYAQYITGKEEEWEKLCLRCGACCGAYEDPCTRLQRDKKGAYFCDVYEHRFGLRRTASNDTFWCVPIREILHRWWPGCHLCVYKKYSHPDTHRIRYTRKRQFHQGNQLVLGELMKWKESV